MEYIDKENIFSRSNINLQQQCQDRTIKQPLEFKKPTISYKNRLSSAKKILLDIITPRKTERFAKDLKLIETF